MSTALLSVCVCARKNKPSGLFITNDKDDVGKCFYTKRGLQYASPPPSDHGSCSSLLSLMQSPTIVLLFLPPPWQTTLLATLGLLMVGRGVNSCQARVGSFILHAAHLQITYWRFSTAWYGTVRHGTARYGTVRLSSGRFAFPPQFSTAIEWAGLFTRRYNCAASTAVTSS